MVLWYLFEQICWNFDIFLLLSAVVHIAYKMSFGQIENSS